MSIAQDIRHMAVRSSLSADDLEWQIVTSFVDRGDDGLPWDDHPQVHWATFMLLCAEALDELPREEMRRAANFMDPYSKYHRIELADVVHIAAVLREAAK